MAARARSARSLLLHGIGGGISAGLVLAVAEMALAEAFGLPISSLLRSVGAIVLGPPAIEPTYPFAEAAVAAVALHLVLSGIYGSLFLLMAAPSGWLAAPWSRLVVYGAIYGLLIWAVNLLMIAPVSFPWFTTADNATKFWMGPVAHTLFFGAALGGYHALLRPRDTEGQFRE